MRVLFYGRMHFGRELRKHERMHTYRVHKVRNLQQRLQVQREHMPIQLRMLSVVDRGGQRQDRRLLFGRIRLVRGRHAFPGKQEFA